MISMAGFTRTIQLSTEQRGWWRALFALTGFPGRPAMGGRTGQLKLRGEKKNKLKIAASSRSGLGKLRAHTHMEGARGGGTRADVGSESGLELMTDVE